MSRRYGQYCGLARALEMVGERWALLVVRDLVLSPKRFTDLQDSLPGIPASILSARLNELEEAGAVRRRILPQLDASVVYELTEYGSELEPALLALGLWGARSLGDAAAGDVFTLDSAILSLYTMFRPERARDVRISVELRYGPDMVLHALVDDGELKVAEGGYADASLVVEARGSLRPLFARELSTDEALDRGLLHTTGDRTQLEVLVDLFHIPAAPRRVDGLAVH